MPGRRHPCAAPPTATRLAIVQLELAKWLTREGRNTEVNHVIAFTQLCTIAPLDTEIAIAAAEACRAHGLAAADAIIFATARAHNCATAATPQTQLRIKTRRAPSRDRPPTQSATRRIPAAPVLNLVRPTTCRSAASTVPAQCDRGACPETRCHVCVPRYALRSPNESLAKPVDRLRPRLCPAALTDLQTGESSLL